MVYTGYLNPARRIEEKYWDHAFASWHSSFEVGLRSPFGVSLALEIFSSFPLCGFHREDNKHVKRRLDIPITTFHTAPMQKLDPNW